MVEDNAYFFFFNYADNIICVFSTKGVWGIQNLELILQNIPYKCWQLLEIQGTYCSSLEWFVEFTLEEEVIVVEY